MKNEIPYLLWIMHHEDDNTPRYWDFTEQVHILQNNLSSVTVKCFNFFVTQKLFSKQLRLSSVGRWLQLANCVKGRGVKPWAVQWQYEGFPSNQSTTAGRPTDCQTFNQRGGTMTWNQWQECLVQDKPVYSQHSTANGSTICLGNTWYSI